MTLRNVFLLFMEPGRSFEPFLPFGLMLAFSLQLQWTEIKYKITSLTADLAAFWQISVKSAPENPSVMFAKKVRSTSLASGVFLKLAFKTPSLEG
jgi:hypothetical protein